MRISIVGCGCVGCVTGVCFADRGNEFPQPTCGSTIRSSPPLRRRPGCLPRPGALRRRFPGRSVRSSPCGPRRIPVDLCGGGERLMGSLRVVDEKNLFMGSEGLVRLKIGKGER